MPQKYQAVNKKTGETIEFDFEGKPTPSDIQAIIANASAKPKISKPRPPIQLPQRDPYVAPPIQPQQPTLGNEFSKLTSKLTTSVFPDVEEDFGKMAGKIPYIGEFAEPATRFITGGATSPLGLATSIAGGGVWARMANKAAKAKTAANAAADTAVGLGPIKGEADDIVSRMNKAFPGFTEKNTGPIAKPRVKILLDKSGKNIGYEMLPDAPAKLPAFEELAVPSAAKPAAKLTGILPRDLQGGKPRFNIGQTSYEPTFKSDIDKALFIIAQKTPSKRNADYMNFLREQTGMTDSQIVTEGMKVRSQLKGILTGKESGKIDIPTLFTPKPVASAGVIPPVKPPVITSGGGGKLPPFDPPEESINKFNTFGQNELFGESLKTPKKASFLQEAVNLPRAAWSGLDLSIPLRQGKGLIHKKEYWTSLDDMVKSAWSEDGFRSVQDSIRSDPRYGRALSNKLAITDLGTDLARREETAMSTWIERIPALGKLYRGSNRAATAFSNKLRFDTFNSLMDDYAKAGLGSDPKLAKKTAEFVNNASGRGSLGRLERVIPELNAVLFSPRFIASRVHMLNPINYLKAPREVQREMLGSAAAITAYWSTIAGAASQVPGVKVGMDPRSSDFGKIVIGNKTRVDLGSGFQQYIRAFSQLVSGEVTSPITGETTKLGEGYRGDTRGTVVANFARTKASPIAGFVWDLFKGTDIAGRPLHEEIAKLNPTENHIAKMFIPNVIQTIYSLAKEDPKLLPLAIPATFGEGIQVYDTIRRPTGKKATGRTRR